jgi:hypothetical protein
LHFHGRLLEQEKKQPINSLTQQQESDGNDIDLEPPRKKINGEWDHSDSKYIGKIKDSRE